MKVKLGDVIDKIVGDEDRLVTDRDYYIGGEHLDSGSIVIRRKGLLNSDKGRTLGYQFHYPFEAGDVLFMTKNPYLKKCGQVFFSGICSIATFVLRTKDESVFSQRFLPVLTQTEDFWSYLEAHKSGSVNYFITWKTLSDYEFELPSIKKQNEIANLAWTIQDTKAAYERLLQIIDELVKSQFVEMFGNPIDNNKGWPTMTIAQATADIISGQCLNGDAGILQPGQKAVLKVSAVTYGYFKEDEYKVLRDPGQITKGVFPQKGDLLFSRANTQEYVGATALIEKDYPDLMLPDKLWKLVFKPIIDPVFAKQFLSHPEVRKVLSDMATGTSGSMYNISMEKLKTLVIIVPGMQQQHEFIEFVQQTDKSKLAAKQALESLDAMQKALMRKHLGEE